MLDCWTINPTDRPKAIEISNGLERWTPDLSAQIEVKCRGAGPGLRQGMNIN